MITISIRGIFFLEEGLRVGSSLNIKVEGHSFLSKYGSDIVCAAVSALTLTAVKSISLVAGLKQKVEQESGKLQSEVFLEACDDMSKIKLEVILEALLIGLNEIKLKYPDRIKILSEQGE